MKKHFAILAALLTASSAFAQLAAPVRAQIYLTASPEDPRTGEIRWVATAKEYVFGFRATPSATTMSEIRYKPAQIAQLKVETPPAYAQIRTQLQSTNPDAAITALNKIVTDYRMLQWDTLAARDLAVLHNNAKRWDETIKLGSGFERDNPDAVSTSTFAPLYWTALQQAGKDTAKIPKWIDTAVAAAPRAVAAAALNVRGDMLRTDNQTKKDALVDGYLRVALLYGTEKEANAEALFKAAQVFNELGQTAYAEKMREQLISAHPGSSWTKKMQGK